MWLEDPGPRREIAWAVAAILLVSGAGLLAWAKVTPWHTDSTAYFVELGRIRAQLDTPGASYDTASAAFFANLHRYETGKWLYADIGYLLLAWAGLIAVLTTMFRTSGLKALLRTHTSPWDLLLATLVGSAGLWVGMVATNYQPLQRQQVPEWADSFDIPLHGANNIFIFLTPILVLLAVAPSLTRPRSGEPVLVVSRRPHWPAVLLSLLYAPFIFAAGFLVVTSYEAGGWACSIAGAIIGWLMLNARAMAIGPRRPPPSR